MSKHHHHECGCGRKERHEKCGCRRERPEECGRGFLDCFCGEGNESFLIFLVLILLVLSCMGGSGI